MPRQYATLDNAEVVRQASRLNGDVAFRRALAQAQLGESWFDSSAGAVLVGDITLFVGYVGGAIEVRAGGALIAPSAEATRNVERYLAYNASTEDCTALFAAPDATDPRIDLVVFALTDGPNGIDGTAAIAVVTGIPDPAPVAPSTPAASVALAEVLIPANETDPANWTITDVREFTSLKGPDLDHDRISTAADGLVGRTTSPLGTFDTYVIDFDPSGGGGLPHTNPAIAYRPGTVAGHLAVYTTTGTGDTDWVLMSDPL